MKYRAVWQQNGRSNPHTGLISEYSSFSRANAAARGFDQGVQVLIDGVWINVPREFASQEIVDLWLAGEREAQAQGFPSALD